MQMMRTGKRKIAAQAKLSLTVGQGLCPLPSRAGQWRRCPAAALHVNIVWGDLSKQKYNTCVSTNTPTHAHTRTHTHTHTHTRAHTPIHAHAHIHAHTHTHIHAHICTVHKQTLLSID